MVGRSAGHNPVTWLLLLWVTDTTERTLLKDQKWAFIFCFPPPAQDCNNSATCFFGGFMLHGRLLVKSSIKLNTLNPESTWALPCSSSTSIVAPHNGVLLILNLARFFLYAVYLIKGHISTMKKSCQALFFTQLKVNNHVDSLDR